MVTDLRVRRLMKSLTSEETLGQAALKSGMDDKTARKYLDLVGGLIWGIVSCCAGSTC